MNDRLHHDKGESGTGVGRRTSRATVKTPKKLDVTALITLVGEEKLQKELDKTTWIYIQLYGGALDFFYRYRTEFNPIEWLVYNDQSFFVEILTRLIRDVPHSIHEHWKKFFTTLTGREPSNPIDNDILIDDVIDRLHQEDEPTLNLSRAVWDIIKGMPIYIFRREILDLKDHEIILLRADGDNYLTDNIDANVEDL